jgi:hypothetical protein
MYCDNAEPTVEELLNDPIARLLMARDGLRAEYVWACVSDLRQKLRVRGAQQSLTLVATGP